MACGAWKRGVTAGQDNGKIASTTNGITGEVVQYTYDSLNRLIQAQATSNSWGQAFVYDGFGNLYQKNVTAGSAPSMQYTVNAATNQLTGNGLGYDANGNMTNPPSGGTLTYDFLNRVVAMTGGVAYSYDASNRRVWKQNSSGQEYYLYGLDGENLGTYTPVLGGSPAQLSFTLASGQERDYFFGKKLFTTEDNVGSAEGAPGHGPTTFYPYGEQKSGTTSEQYGFATYWEDSESGLDYAGHRFYSSTLGRFLSPDPSMDNIDYGNSGSWNAYAYTMGDPVNGNDPSGLVTCGDLQVDSGGTVSDYLLADSDAGLLTRFVWAEGGTLSANGGSQTAMGTSQMLVAQAVENRLAVANGQVAVQGADGNIYWGDGGTFNGVTVLRASILGYGGLGTNLAQEIVLAAAGTSEVNGSGELNDMSGLEGTLDTDLGDPTRDLPGRVPVTLDDGSVDYVTPECDRAISAMQATNTMRV
jgi:RHS repeat-associated protein